MSLPEIVGREEWTRARVALLEREKALTGRATSSPPRDAGCPWSR